MLFPQILGAVTTLCCLAQAAPLVPQPDELSEFAFRRLSSLAASKQRATDQASDHSTQLPAQDIAKRDVTINMIMKWFENSGITLDDVMRDHGLLESRSPL